VAPKHSLPDRALVPLALLGDGYIRQTGLVPHLLPFSNATLWRKVKRGEFPRPLKLSRGVTAWDMPEIRGWLLTCGDETT
jgi:predicted DNA-binding transcriptional regulator AlpA